MYSSIYRSPNFGSSQPLLALKFLHVQIKPLNQAVEGSQQLVWYNPKQQTHAHNDVKLNFCEIIRGMKAYRTALPLIVVNVYVNAREWFTCTSRCSNHTVTCPVLTVTWTTGGFWRSLDSRCTRSGRTVRKNRFAIHIAYLHVFHTQLASPNERSVCETGDERV